MARFQAPKAGAISMLRCYPTCLLACRIIVASRKVRLPVNFERVAQVYEEWAAAKVATANGGEHSEAVLG